VRDMRSAYLDAFPIQSRRQSMSSEGFYMSSANASHEELQNLDSYEQLTHFPKGINAFSVLALFKPSLKRWQDGFRTLAGPANARRVIFYHGGFGPVKGDYVQQQQSAGCLGQKASHPDRFSCISQENLDNYEYDIHRHRNTLDQRRDIRQQMSRCQTQVAKQALATANGLLAQPSIFEDPEIFVNPLVHIPPMNEHSEVAGMNGLVVTELISQFTDRGQQLFARALQEQPLPPHWSSLPQPRLSTSSKKLMMGIEDLKRTMQLLPFVLTPCFLHLPVKEAEEDEEEKKTTKKKKTKQVEKKDHLVAKFTENALEKWHAKGSANILGELVTAAAWSQKHIFAKTRKAGSPLADEQGSCDSVEVVCVCVCAVCVWYACARVWPVG
jgi:hypothetical protein